LRFRQGKITLNKIHTVSQGSPNNGPIATLISIVLHTLTMPGDLIKVVDKPPSQDYGSLQTQHGQESPKDKCMSSQGYCITCFIVNHNQDELQKWREL